MCEGADFEIAMLRTSRWTKAYDRYDAGARVAAKLPRRYRTEFTDCKTEVHVADRQGRAVFAFGSRRHR